MYLCQRMNRVVRIVLCLLLTSLVVGGARAQSFFPSSMLDGRVNALQIKPIPERKEWIPFPYYTLGGKEGLLISFDLLDDEPHTLRYQLQHCDTEWNPSGLAKTEFQSGYSEGEFPPSIPSSLTKVSYRHYSLTLSQASSPHPILSGNYLLTVYDAMEPERPLVQAAFAVVEPLATLVGNVDKTWGIDPHKQHLEVSVGTEHLEGSTSDLDFTLVVAQNSRRDNVLWVRHPSFRGLDQLQYRRELLAFEAGNEYHAMEYLSPYIPSLGVERSAVEKEANRLILYTNYNRSQSDFHSTDQGAMGQYVIRSRNLDGDIATATDYYRVCFRLESEPLADGLQPILEGEAFDYLPYEERLLHYSDQEGAYTAELLLKGGYLSYLYLAAKEEESRPYTAQAIEGNHYPTHNQYTLFVYYHPLGARYHRLVGVTQCH